MTFSKLVPSWGIAGAVLALALMVSQPVLAEASSLDAGRTEGVIAERYDGFVMLRDGQEAGAYAPVIAETNSKRQDVYTQRAAAEAVPAEEVGKVYAREIFRNAPSGTWFLNADGSWAQKD